VQRAIAGTANEIGVTNGDGVAGAPTVYLPSALTFTGKTLTGGTFTGPTITANDNALTLRDDGDATKQLQFQLSGLTTGTLRTLVVPDASTTLVGTDTAQTLTNKSIVATQLTGTLQAAQFPALTGDVTTPGGSLASTIAANAVTYAKMQQVAASALIGNPTGSTANVQGVALGSTLAFSGSELRTGAGTGDVSWSANSFSTTLATVNSNVGSFGSATQCASLTVNAKGLITAASATTCAPAWASITGTPTTLAGYGITNALVTTSNLSDVSSKPTARGSSGLNIFGGVDVGDTNYTIVATDRGVNLTTTLTAVRTLTLPAASAVNKGEPILISDAAGAINGSNTITVARAGSDTINGVSSVSITAQYAVYLFYSDGVSKWTYLAAGAGGGGGSGTVTSVDASCGLKTSSGSAITTSGTIVGSRAVNAQTGTTYTVLDGDCGKLVTTSNASSIAVTLPQAGASSQFVAGWSAIIANIGAGTATITPTTSTINGAASLALATNQATLIVSDGTNYHALIHRNDISSKTRDVLSSNRTYYVRTDGSNSNDGLTNSAGGAFLTIAKAMTVAAALDLGGNAVTVQVGAGTYAEAVTLAPLIGGTGTLIGDTTTPSNVVISATSAHAVQATNGNRAWTVRGFKLTTTTAGYGLHINNGSAITYNNLDFGAAAGGQITVLNVSSAICTGNYSISGGAPWHWFGDSNSTISSDADTITLSGTPAFSTAFAFANGGAMLKVDANTFSGSATGKRYQVQNNAVIFVNGAGTSYLPGNSAGTGTNAGASPYGLYN
jgi:hypothetical protein